MKRYSREYYLKNKKKISEIMHRYYLANKDKIRRRIDNWEKNNPYILEWQKDYYNNTWFPKNRRYMAKKMREYYYKNTSKQASRCATYKILNGWKANLQHHVKEHKPFIKIKKECKICKTRIGLQIHHEIYPTKWSEVIQAIKDGKIYYICKEHHPN